PKGFHRIRHYGLLASGVKAENLARMRTLLDVAPPEQAEPAAVNGADAGDVLPTPCPCCGGRMLIIERFEAGCQPRHHASPSRTSIRIDTS
ncbi:MAG: IS91 family transposase, partial [Hyphomicrobium sp.]